MSYLRALKNSVEDIEPGIGVEGRLELLLFLGKRVFRLGEYVCEGCEGLA